MQRAHPLRSLVVIAAFTFAGCAGLQLAPSDVKHPGQVLFNGHAKEEVNCYRCHNGDARGTMRGPSLAGTSELSDSEIVEYIDEGEGIMPSFADKLTHDEKLQIVSWLRTEFGGPDSAEPAAAEPATAEPAAAEPAIDE